jgi:predicted GIY-YIG superfamily endonuclease
MKGYVYILQDDNGKYYIGSTSDLARRMRQHALRYTPTTKRMAKPRLILHQEYQTLTEARRVETKIKRLKRKDYIDRMVQDGYIKLRDS